MLRWKYHVFAAHIPEETNRLHLLPDNALCYTYVGVIESPSDSVVQVAQEFVTKHHRFKPGSWVFVAPAWSNQEPRFFQVQEETKRYAKLGPRVGD